MIPALMLYIISFLNSNVNTLSIKTLTIETGCKFIGYYVHLRRYCYLLWKQILSGVSMKLWSSFVQYQDKIYDLVETTGSGLFNPADFKSIQSAHWRGYAVGYDVNESKLFLNSLDLYSQNGSKQIAPIINDVKPVENGYSDYSYTAVKMPIFFSGTFLAGYGYEIDNSLSLGKASKRFYKKVLFIRINTGSVIETKEIPSQIHKIMI